MGDAAWIVGKGDETHTEPVDMHKSDGVNALVTAQVTHALIHAGKMFTISGLIEGVADGAAFVLGITIPAGKEVHFVIEGAATGDAHGHMFENSTFSGGTLTTPVNRDRTSSNVLTGYTFAINPTEDVQGDEIFSTFMPGGSKKAAAGSSGESFGEWIFGPGSYLLRFENHAGAVATMSALMTFYEESD